MLYVPLFFYIFDRLAERSDEKKKIQAGRDTSSEIVHNNYNPESTVPNSEGGH
jgi:hypothetical protein